MASTNAFQVAVKELEQVSITAGSAVSKGLAVSFDKSVANSAGEAIHGIAKADAVSGARVTIVTHGEAIAIAGGTVTLGAALATDNAGKMVAATTGKEIFGRALEGASANEYFKILITREGVSA